MGRCESSRAPSCSCQSVVVVVSSCRRGRPKAPARRRRRDHEGSVTAKGPAMPIGYRKPRQRAEHRSPSKHHAHSSPVLVGSDPRRRRLRMAAGDENQDHVVCRGPVAGARHWRVYLGLPADRRGAAAAIADRRCGSAVRALTAGGRAGWQAFELRRLGPSGLPADARCGAERGRVDRRLVQRNGPTSAIRLAATSNARMCNMSPAGCLARSGSGPPRAGC